MGVMKLLVNNLYKVHIEGIEKIDFTKPTILMPNHISLIDAIILALNLPENVCFVANTEIAKKYAFFLKNRKHIAVDPLNPMSVRQMIKVINSGVPLMIFPEGRITVTGGLMKVYNGVGYIALKTKANIYPIAIDGADYSKFSYLNKINNTKILPKVKVQIGDPFVIEKQENISMKEQKKQSANTILKVLQKSLFEIRNKTNINLFNELIDCSKKYGSKTKIVKDITKEVDYKTILLSSCVLGNKLSSIFKEEQNIGILLPSSIGHVVTLFSLFKIGKTPAILNFSMGSQNLIDCCETADVKTVLTSKVFVEKGNLTPLIDELQKQVKILYLEDIQNSLTFQEKLSGKMESLMLNKVSIDKNELILFTSGSESKPKGVLLTHDNLFANIQQARSIIDLTQQDKLLNVLPMFHSFGLTAGTLLPLLCGVSVFLYPSPLHYKVIPEIAYDFKATILFGTSTFLYGYAKNAHEYDFFSMRYVFAGAEKLKDEVRDLWFQKFGIRVYEGYGATETSPILSLNTPLFSKQGSVGNFLPGVSYKLEPVEGIKEGGKLLVKGPNIMKGYLIHQKGFIPADEWYDTGDIVDVDHQGYIYIKSRLKRFAKIGGEMVSLNLVEEIAGKCFNEHTFASINISDLRKGERVILYTENKLIKIEQLREYITKNKYSALLIPSQIKYIDKLPLLGSGKVDYVLLKNLTEQDVQGV